MEVHFSPLTKIECRKKTVLFLFGWLEPKGCIQVKKLKAATATPTSVKAAIIKKKNYKSQFRNKCQNTHNLL